MQDTLPRDVYWLLRSTSSRLKDEFRKKIEDYGITWPQFHALYHIGDQGLPANELARELHCNASNMTGIIDRMTENGWVYREHSEADRRVWLVKLTEKGLQLKADIFPQHKQNIAKRMGVLSPEELVSLEKLLKKLRDGTSGEENS